MMAERSQEIERLYHEARERDPSEREAFLDRACVGDEPLRAEVESLLAWREHAAGFLEPLEPAPATAAATENHPPTRTTAIAQTGYFRRQPWWVWCCSVPSMVAAASLYVVWLTAPQPAGWKLTAAERRPASYQVIAVARGTAAERAGFEVGDLIPIADVERFARDQRPGGSYRLEVFRAGRHQTHALTLPRNDWIYWRGRDGLRKLGLLLASVAHLALAGILIFTRPRDRAARWGALLFAQLGFYMAGPIHAAAAPEGAYILRALPLPIGVLIGLAKSLSATTPAGVFGFCAVFPEPSRFTTRRWWPWWLIAVALVATVGIDLKFWWLPVYAGPYRPDVPRLAIDLEVMTGVIFVAWTLALVARSYRRIDRPNERRRLRLVVAGFGVTVAALTVEMIRYSSWKPVDRGPLISFWQFAWVFLLSAAALCTAYAILRHRVFDIHVIVRLGLRYAAARGVLLSVVPVVALALAFDVLMHRDQAVRQIAAERGLLYVVLAGAALALHVKRKSWMDALDRRFFRERYDAYRLLAGVADDVRHAQSFEEAVQHVIDRIEETLHPQSASLMVSKPADTCFHSAVSIGHAPPRLPEAARLVGLARVLGKPIETAQAGTGWLQQQLPRVEVEFLRRASAEWIFPVALRQTGTQALLLLGPKRSEEPYSREDRHLLEAVTASLGLLLEHPALTGFTECSTCGACLDKDAAHCPTDNGTLVKSPYPRTIAGRYRFDRRLGRGGMGVVYEAFDTQLKRQVAVKVIRPDLMTSPGAVARFRREARTAARLRHPSVVDIYDFGVADDGRTYLVMELLKGRSLREELRERRTLDSKAALDVMRAVSGAVALAHAKGLLHRDLKPENIFLARSEHGHIAKILDFGLVKPLNPGCSDTVGHTLTGAAIGTPAYMSPEQRRGAVADETWDLWALAVVAFEMLTGTHPFAFSADSASQMPIGSSPDRCVEAPVLSPSAQAFFERAFALESSRRPMSVRQFIEELEIALE